ncbi:hypothetical protein M409DRAFT_70852 [Zasmidium cellare ATCC 36951]|uniref:Uncharacterized protein n=1 Tax=Zasmidium cellare ATCC 36951 TaxID=1080233 RepID=A0A6A6BXZ3_ZASCE|nr:uncharacterized protein M409DRAFT_70852 [Zasmidium cellare ATCC 36951]KAF2159667.1 hypothetical protein M409DRAFT_70852 [Zasmidium cellare ATCC 36951]
MSMLNPFASPDDANSKDNDDAALAPNADAHSQNQSALKHPSLATVPNINQHSRGPPSPSRSSGSIMFAEPDTRSNSEDGSREGSFDGLKRAKRAARPKTQFSICHPPTESKTLQKLHRRPRSLLQFHKLSANARPRPSLEIIPSINFSVKLQRAITRVFKSKHSLCTNDLVVLKAEKYSREEADVEQEMRDVVGLICKGKKDEEKNAGGKAQIHMANGKVWEAYPTPNGGYEFFTADEHGLGLTVRWVPKKSKDGKVATKAGKRRFNFSTISPNSRKHPIIATLSSTGLDVNDTYKMPDGAAVTPLSTPKATTTVLEEAMNDEDEQLQHETDDQLREIITMTAIWVVFKEGWSPNFKYEDKDKEGAIFGTSPGKTGSTPVNTPPGSPAQIPMDKRSSLKSLSSGIIRRTSVLSRSARSSTYSVREEDEPIESPAPSRSASVVSRTGRTRADSTATVLVHRAASNRRKNNQQATWRPDLIVSQDPLQETSREDLSREFNSTPTPKKKPSPLANGENTHQRKDRQPRIRDSVDKPEHRESLATDTSASSTPAKVVDDGAVPPTSSSNGTVRINRKAKRKSGGWRRLLCGSSDV